MFLDEFTVRMEDLRRERGLKAVVWLLGEWGCWRVSDVHPYLYALIAYEAEGLMGSRVCPWEHTEDDLRAYKSSWAS